MSYHRYWALFIQNFGDRKKTATYWPPLLWPSAFLSRSPGMLNRGPRAQPLWDMLSFQHLLSNSSDPQNWLNFLGTKLYNSSTSTQFLPITDHWNMHFRAEITVMQFTGHPLPVHQFVTVPWDLSAKLTHANGICNFRRLWNGMFGRVGGQYTTIWH